MASTPSSRLRLTPSNSPFLGRPSRSPIRPQKAAEQPARLSLKRVVGNTCTSPTGLDTVNSCFAYVAGGAVVVVDVQEDQYSQRFYRARPTATPTYGVSPVPHAPSTPNSTPKANDSRNRGPPSDWSDNPSSKTWSQRERIKAATCVSLSRDGRFLAVGETGFAPRVLIFNLQDNSSDIPLVSISEHAFGVAAVAFSKDAKYLGSLGSANDGFLYIWRIDQRTGAARLFQQNRCTSSVRGMVWIGNSLVTFGVRHVKAWKVEEQAQATSPSKQKFPGDGSFPVPQYQKPLPGRNVLLGSLLEATFTCAAVISDDKAILCSETGDISILDDSGKQMRLLRVTNVEFPVQCISVCDQTAYVGGKSGQFTTIDVVRLCDDGDCVLGTGKSAEGTLAMGFVGHRLVTTDAKRSIAIWNPGQQPAKEASGTVAVPIPGYSDAIMGVGVLSSPNPSDSAFFTWSGCGKVVLWGSDGSIRSSFEVSVEQPEVLDELEPPNELCIVAASKHGQLFVTADRLGVLKVIDFNTKECLMDTRAHASMCQVVAIYEYEDNSRRAIIASCGRDRTTQLFRRTSTGTFEHFQTLEFAAKVVHVLVPSEDKVITCSMDRTLQIHDLVSKEGDPDSIAAIPSRVITLKGSPSSMVMDDRSVFVSLLDRSVCQYDISTGRLLNTFKCIDEGGAESVVLDSLIYGQPLSTSEPSFLLGVSNTDKSVRIYDSQRGSFLGRDWGHSQAINGVILLEDEGQTRTVVSVASDGTIMIWALDLSDPIASSMSRDPSPAKEPVLTSSKPTLRKVLSKAELAEFQRPSSSGGRRSPPRTLSRRTSKYGLLATGSRTPTPASQTSPGSSTIVEDSSSRRVSSGSGDSGTTPPPVSPRTRGVCRRPSLPALSTTPPAALASSMLLSGPRKKQSTSSLRSSPALASSSSTSTSPYGFGTLSMATEQTCRTLRAYRKKLAAADTDPQQQPIRPEILAELDAELRLTAAALGDRAIRDSSSTAIHDSLLSGLLDTYSERLVSMLDEKLRLRASLGSPSPEIGTQTVLLGQDTQRSSYSSTSSSDLNIIVT
ncbi:hypothetical protein MCOR02_002642 [Pyricularia oryzae]|nr:hypothetical protein MCOR02_002642 [Pyricularia oryzae]KAI6447527.1 hypothetical protein MCOR17_010514 [Pyricularia oryzae]KAI6485245.1 hypothetical protein MCOR13_009737 [Pyricularia oryzae]KAI6633467.1 hypothetical protein MCOR14_006699 [Pyricularia oryzae]